MDRKLSALRGCILLALSSCPKDWPVCGNEEELSEAEYGGYGTLREDDFLVCGDLPEDGGPCPDKDELRAWEFFEENVGESSNGDDQRYSLEMDCGPETTRTDACCYVIAYNGSWIAGRPFVAGGRERLATVRGAPTDARAAWWTAMARAEHASVAAFAWFTLELLALGAPVALLAASARAQADEVVHARLAFGLASRFAGATIEPGPLRATRTLGPVDPRAVAVALAREGCVGETLSAAATAIAGGRCEEERRVLARISRDEQRHAALAWRTARWLLGAYPEARAPFANALDAAGARVGGELGRRLVAQVARPCSAALFAGLG